MQPNVIGHVSELTKEKIGDLYFRSLSNIETRKMHLGLSGRKDGPNAIAPSVHDIGLDFTAWYGGVVSVGKALDPTLELPLLKDMVDYIGQNPERAKTAIAA